MNIKTLITTSSFELGTRAANKCHTRGLWCHCWSHEISSDGTSMGTILAHYMANAGKEPVATIDEAAVE